MLAILTRIQVADEAFTSKQCLSGLSSFISVYSHCQKIIPSSSRISVPFKYRKFNSSE